MATIGDGFKDIFLAGIGAMAITAEKSKDLVDQLISKGAVSYTHLTLPTNSRV